MRKKIKQILSDSFYRKTLYIYFVVLIILFSVIFMVLFGIMVYSFQETATENSHVLLEALSSSSQFIKSDLTNLMVLLANDSSTSAFVREKQENKVTNYYLHLKLLEYKSIYSQVVDISVVNLDSGISVQAVGTNVNGNANLALARELWDTKDELVVRTLYFFRPNIRYDVVSFIYKLPNDNSMIVVDVDSLRFHLGLPEGSTEGRDVGIVTESGQWISYPERYAAMDLSRDDLQEILSENAADQKSFSKDIRKQRLFLFFNHANGLDWWFIDVQSYSGFNESFATVIKWFMGIVIAFLALCVGIGALFNRRVQRPLTLLIEKYRSDYPNETRQGNEIKYLGMVFAKMEHEHWLNDQYVVSFYLRNLLLGLEIPFSFSQERQRAFQEKYSANKYRVILIQGESDRDPPKEEGPDEMDMIRYIICNLAKDIFGEQYRCETSDLGGNLVAVLLMLDDNQTGQEYLSCFRRLKEVAGDHEQVVLRGVLGLPVDRFEEIWRSCAEAMQYLNVDGLIPPGSLIDIQTLSTNSYSEKKRKLVESMEAYTEANFNDPNLSLKRLSDQFGLSTTYLGKIFKSIKGMSYSSFVTRCRLERSRLVLVETNKTVNEVATDVGFSNSTYFATVFKNTYGVTPTTYRNNAKSNIDIQSKHNK